MGEEFKIRINKDDELAIVAAKVLSADSEDITLIIPKSSKLAQNADNFHFLKRSADEAGKVLHIESVDEEVIKLAAEADISAVNPFFNRKPIKEQWPELEIEEAKIEPTLVAEDVFQKAEKELEKSFKKSPINPRRLWNTILILLLLAVSGWAAAVVLPQAKVKVITQKSKWEFNGKVVIDPQATAADISNLVIPGQVFRQKKNIQLTFSTANTKPVERKAKGKIIIYNAYSSKPQPLVATTRFQAPDGKIIRIDERVIVPGAQVINGKIIPSSIEASVTADKPGEEYNIGPLARLTVPGFKGSDKFNGFYGELKEPLSGGYIGLAADPTEEEIEKARQETANKLKQSLQLVLRSQIPQEFEILDDSAQFKVLKEKIDTNTGKSGDFSVFLEAEMSVMGFRKKDLIAALEAKAKKELGEEYRFKDYDLDYKSADGSLSVNIKAIAEKPVATNDLKKKIAGKSEEELRAMVFSLPEIKEINIVLSPFWVKRVPKNPDKLEITVE